MAAWEVGVDPTVKRRKAKRILKAIDALIRQARIPVYLHHFGPKTYTTWQHCKAWLLKERLKCSWRELVEDWAPYFLPDIADRSTLIKFVKRLPFWIKNTLVARSAGSQPAEYGAIDATGLSRTNASSHFIRRIDRRRPLKRPLKLSTYTAKRRILAFRLRARWRGDTLDVPYLLKQSPVLAETNCLDKGYDSNEVHAQFRNRGVFSIIAVKKNCRGGAYRKVMRDYFDYGQYWERNCAEYNYSTFKRRFGEYVRSVLFRAQHSEVAARIILHNLRALPPLYWWTFSPEPVGGAETLQEVGRTTRNLQYVGETTWGPYRGQAIGGRSADR